MSVHGKDLPQGSSASERARLSSLHSVASTGIPSCPSELCQKCWDTLFGPDGKMVQLLSNPSNSWYDPERGYNYMTSCVQLEQSSTAGCRWCKLVLKDPNTSSFLSIPSFPGGEAPIEVGITIYRGESRLKAQALNMRFGPRQRDRGTTFCCYTKSDDPASSLVIARDLVREVKSLETCTLARECLEECSNNHDTCLPILQSSILPTRLVDCQDIDRPRLVATSGESGQYVALSYVWGEAQPHSTTSRTIKTYLDHIDPAVLPQTIKDAISMTHNLGFRFLWVDTLCIVQDSSDDKAMEIGQMARIYSTACFTIVAASASKVSEGFLQTRAEVFTPDATVPIFSTGSGTLGTLYLFDQYRSLRMPRDPISFRGWCLQEWMLSPRSFVFSSHTVQYHCSKAIANVGNGFTPWTPELGKRLPRMFYLPEDEIPPLPSDHSGWYKLRRHWWDSLDDYTARSITVPSDKLVAIGGIAQHLNAVFKTRYLAGLWEDGLLEDLLWTTEQTHSPRPKAYRAPSWSWASVDGKLAARLGYTTRSAFIKTYVEIIRCTVTPKTQSLPYGEVTAGLIVLRAPVIEASVQRSRKDPGSGKVFLTLSTHRRLCKESGEEITTPITPQTSKFAGYKDWWTKWYTNRVYIGRAQMDTSDDHAIRDVRVLVIWTNSELSSVEGLLLVPAQDGSVYRRVGRFSETQWGKGLSYANIWLHGVEKSEISIV